MSDGWRLISPPENWRNPIHIDEPTLSVLEEAGRRLGLRFRRDEQQKKFYFGHPNAKDAVPAAPETAGPRVTYPSGRSFAVVTPSEAEAARYGVTGIYAAARLIQAAGDEPLSDHFRAAEFFCHDPSYRFLRVSPELVRKLEELRAASGGHALTVHSAFRPPEYNQMIGGAPGSAHIDGLAADVSASGGVSTYELYRAADRIIGNAGGVGYYPALQFVHVDVRGEPARWTG